MSLWHTTLDIVFVKPRYYYQSYTDFWELVRLSNFRQCYIDQIDLKSSDTYIITMVDPKRDKWHLSWWQKRRKQARLIFWDLERPKPRGGVEADKRFLDRQNFDEVWHSDYQLAKELGTRYVILGSDVRLGNEPAIKKKYDVAHMSFTNDRRRNLLDRIKVKIGPNCWGKKRDKVLRHAKFGLTVHQDDDFYIEPLRLALFASYELPIISERSYSLFPLSDIMLQTTYSNLVSFVPECVEDYSSLKELGKEIKQRLCVDYQFGNVVRYTVRN